MFRRAFAIGARVIPLARETSQAITARHVSTASATRAAASSLHDSVLSTVGSTPIVRVNRLAPEGVNVYAKCEAFNPMSSVKDRLALGIIEDAERSGALQPGTTIVESTSGNTGIALAMVCAAKGYPLVITMAETFSVERRKLMRMLGARVVLTPAAERGTGMVKKAKELAEAHGWFQPLQFANQANADYHASTTGPEILRAFAGEPIDFFVTGYGSGGTLQGVGRAIKAASPSTQIVVAEPSDAPLLSSGEPQTEDDTGALNSHAAFSPHPIQGWTPDFIPPIVKRAEGLYDSLVQVSGADAMATSRALAKSEGILTGISGGAGMHAALAVAATAPKGSNILTVLPDTGERYLSTPLFDAIQADMDDEEHELSLSTPGFQMPE